jgi:hypothetical protein
MRLSGRTIREQWERARKVNIAGDQLTTDAGPLADAPGPLAPAQPGHEPGHVFRVGVGPV